MGKSGTSTVTKNIVVVNSGKKGAWNQAMNKPEPNTIYKVDGNKTSRLMHWEELVQLKGY